MHGLHWPPSIVNGPWVEIQPPNCRPLDLTMGALQIVVKHGWILMVTGPLPAMGKTPSNGWNTMVAHPAITGLCLNEP